MHRATEPAIYARVPREDLRQRPVDDEINRQVLRRTLGSLFDNAQTIATEVVAHDRHQRWIVELMNRRETLGKNLTMRAVRTEDVVVRVEQVCLTNRRRLLADRKMRRPPMIVREVLEMPLLLHRVEHLLERADDHHVALDAHQVGLRHRSGRHLVRHAAIVLIQRNRLEFEHAPRTHFDGIDKYSLRH